MKATEEFAHKTSQALVTSRGVPTAYAINPIIVLAIIQIIIELVKLFRTCDLGPQQVVDRSKNPGIFGRRILRRIVRQNVAQHVGSNELRELGPDIEAAIREVGLNGTVEQYEALFTEV